MSCGAILPWPSGRQMQCKLFAIATEERHPLFPDVPTFKELGIDMVGGAYPWHRGSASTPEDIRQQLSDAIGEVNANPEFRKRMEDDGYALIEVPYDPMPSFMAEQSAIYEEVAGQLRSNN